MQLRQDFERKYKKLLQHFKKKWLHTPCFEQKNGDLSITIENCLGYRYEVNIFKIFVIVKPLHFNKRSPENPTI